MNTNVMYEPKYYETDGDKHVLDLLIILHESHVSYLTRSECREKSF